MKLDKLDKKIICALQSNGRASVETIAAAVGLTPTPTRRRIKRLEEQGAITGYAAIVDPAKCGLTLTVYVFVRLERRNRKTIDGFERAIKRLDEIVRCDLVSGSFDYMLMLHLPAIEDYNRYLHAVISDIPGIAAIETSIVIGGVKASHKIALFPREH
jgi:Lrp/AsnC family transcriptional regulator, leucine-responsive regulatory protein